MSSIEILEQIKPSIISRDATIVQEFSSGYTGNPNSVEDVKKFLLSYFLSSRRYIHTSEIKSKVCVNIYLLNNFRKKNSEKKTSPLYHHFTVAVDTNNIRIVFKDVKDTILKKNLDSLLLQ